MLARGYESRPLRRSGTSVSPLAWGMARFKGEWRVGPEASIGEYLP